MYICTVMIEYDLQLTDFIFILSFTFRLFLLLVLYTIIPYTHLYFHKTNCALTIVISMSVMTPSCSSFTEIYVANCIYKFHLILRICIVMRTLRGE